MSKIPANCRSFQRVVLNVEARACVAASLDTSLKSGAARRIFSTPSPVPVRIQSWAKMLEEVSNNNAKEIAVNRLVISNPIDGAKVPRIEGPVKHESEFAFVFHVEHYRR